MAVPLAETHSLQTLRMVLSTGSPLKARSYEYVYRCIKSSVLLGSISGAPAHGLLCWVETVACAREGVVGTAVSAS